ncbi:MAG TPA: alpha/beta fold hydrolase [Naasia sp.]|jgi:3-oxoadipate enol-lactonase
MPTAQINGITTNYLLEGEGPETVVLINGLADDLYSWDFQVPALLEAGYRILRFDNRGIGASDKPAGPYTSRMLADDAKALVDSLGITDFHLMGVSMGGMIAEEYALAYSSDVRTLTLACTYGTPDPFCLSMFSFWADLAQKVDPAFVMRDVMLWAFTGPFFEDRPEDAAEFAGAMATLDMTVEAYLSQLNVIQQHDALGRVAEIGIPTLVLAGEEDILIPVRLSRRLHEGIPGSEWRTVPGGHACMWEFPDEFNASFIDYLRSTSR